MILLDIGSTLLGGPTQGPAQRLRAMLALAPEQVATITQTMFTTSYSTEDELSVRLAERLRLDRAVVLEAVTRLWHNQREETYALPGAQTIVTALREAGVPRAYLSNIWPPFFEGFARFFPAETHGSPCYLSFRTGLTKPDPRFFHMALTDSGATPQDSIMVGDTYQDDIAPAIALGMKTVWILHRPEKERADIVRVLNGDTPAPTRTLASIGDLTLDDLRSL